MVNANTEFHTQQTEFESPYKSPMKPSSKPPKCTPMKANHEVDSWDFVLASTHSHCQHECHAPSCHSDEAHSDDKTNSEDSCDKNKASTNKKRMRRSSNASNISSASSVQSSSSSESPEKKLPRRNRRKSGALTPMVLEDESEGQRLYKTELCRSWEERGYCRYGEKCQFAHGIDELRPLVRHNKYKSELCRYFHVEGTCMYGTRCCFIHTFKKSEVAKVLSQNIFCLQCNRRRLPVFETICDETVL